MDESLTNETTQDVDLAEDAADPPSQSSGEAGTAAATTGDSASATPATADSAADPPSQSSGEAGTAATTGPRELNLNELQKIEDLRPIARDFGLQLHPARTRHHHILDIARSAIGRGASAVACGRRACRALSDPQPWHGRG